MVRVRKISRIDNSNKVKNEIKKKQNISYKLKKKIGNILKLQKKSQLSQNQNRLLQIYPKFTNSLFAIENVSNKSLNTL